MRDLIAKLEKLEGPDRSIDALVEIELRRLQAYAVGLTDQTRAYWKPVGEKGEIEEGGTRYHAPEYTASLDAVIALVERVLPGWAYSVSDGDEHGPWAAVFQAGGGQSSTAVMAETPAIALLLALLRAKEAQDG